MKRTSPTARVAATGRSLTGSIESCVRWVDLFWPIIEQNKPQIFDQFDKNPNEKLFT
jgi:hypothetical protein